MTKSAALDGTDNKSMDSAFLGNRNKDFQFSDLKLTKVSFAECSARGAQGENGQGHLEQIEEWINQIAWSKFIPIKIHISL